MSRDICFGFENAIFDDDTVVILGRELTVPKRQPVARYLCRACGDCALVNARTLDDADERHNLASELSRAVFCGAAMYVAPHNEGLSSTADSVVQ